MTLWQFSAREIKSRPGRAGLTLISVVIGVAAVVAVAMSVITTHDAYEEMYQTLTGRAAVEILSATGGGFDDAIVDELSKRADVQAVVPILQRITIVYAGQIESQKKRMKIQAMGIDPQRDSKVRDYKLVKGKFFGKDGKGVLLETEFARTLGVDIGGEVRLLTPSGAKKLDVVGLLAPEGAAAFRQGVMFLSLNNAQKLFRAKNKVDTIHLVPKDFAKSDELLKNVASSLPPGLIARPPAARSQLSRETLESTQQGLELASALSLIVAVFIILNTFLMNVSERRRQLAILRAIGATKGQIRRLLIGEGLLLGFIGTAIGMVVGMGGAFYLTRVMENLFQTSLPSLKITPMPFVLGAALGLGVSLLATYLPAVRASRVSPLEGMRPVTQEDLEGVSSWVTLAGIALLAISGVLTYAFFVGLWLRTVPIIAAVLALIGFIMLIPAALQPLSKFVTFLLRPILKIEGELAQRQLLRRRVRTTLTTGVLFVAITTGIGLGTTIVNNVDDVGHWFERTVLGDFFIRATMPDMASGLSAEVPENLSGEILSIPGVVGVSSARIVSVQVMPAPTMENKDPLGAILIARDFSERDRLELDLRDGKPEEVRKDLFAGDVVIGTVLAKRSGLKLGDTIELAREGQTHKFRIAATSNEYYVGGLALYIQREVAKRVLGVEGVDGYAVRVDENLDRGSRFRIETKLKEIAEREGLLMQSHESLRAMVDDLVNGVTGGLWVLLALGFVVAGFGIVNTLTMNVLEQTRELGLLRIVAMTRGQVRKLILSQAVIMGFIGLVPGAIVGAGIAYLVSRSSEGEFGRSIDFTLHPVMFFGAFVAAYAIVVIAAWIPAQRAARLQLTEALRYE